METVHHWSSLSLFQLMLQFRLTSQSCMWRLFLGDKVSLRSSALSFSQHRAPGKILILWGSWFQWFGSQRKGYREFSFHYFRSCQHICFSFVTIDRIPSLGPSVFKPKNFFGDLVKGSTYQNQCTVGISSFDWSRQLSWTSAAKSFCLSSVRTLCIDSPYTEECTYQGIKEADLAFGPSKSCMHFFQRTNTWKVMHWNYQPVFHILRWHINFLFEVASIFQIFWGKIDFCSKKNQRGCEVVGLC